jgi:glycosyltransferase involved in cell wall biosynthesis
VKLLYFTKESEEGPSSRYRVYQYLPYLRNRGIEVCVRPLFGATYFKFLSLPWPAAIMFKAVYAPVRFMKRFVDLVTMGHVDLLIVEGQLFPYLPPIFERILVWAKQKIVIELDDAIYLTRLHGRKIPQLMASAAGVIVGNDTIAEYARAYTKNVYVIPTVVDTKRFLPNASSAPAPERILTIGWIGLPYNFGYLQLIRDALRRVQDLMQMRFRVISSHPPDLPGVDVEFRRWSLATEVEDLQDCQLGVMPLFDDRWARGKCGLKLLQYMAMGIPAVASPVGVNKEIINDGKNGFWATTEEEWFRRLMQLCQDTPLRATMGRAARQTIVEQYSLDAWAPRLETLYRNLAAKPADV